MNVETFWRLIEQYKQQSMGNDHKQMELLIETLANLPSEVIQEFDRILWSMMLRAYRADLWETASLVGCGCSDDGFHEFKGWLISQGETIYEKVLDDPQKLADVVDKRKRLYIFNGRMTSVAEEAYEQKTGQEIPESGFREKAVLVGGKLAKWEELPAKYPQIMAKLGECGEETWST